MTGNEVIEKLKAEKPILQNKFGVEEIGIFGSYARGDMDPESDIDIIVNMKTPDYSLLVQLYMYLEKMFNKKIDLIRKGKHLTERFLNNLKDEVIYV